LLDCINFLREAGASVTFIAVRATGSLHSRYTRHLQQLGVAVYALPTDPIDQILISSNFDLALLTFWPVAERVMPLFRRYSPSSRLVLDSIDMHFLRDARRSVQITGSALPKFDSDYGEQFVGELNAYADADLVLTVSDKETGMLEEYLGATTPIRSIPLCEEIKLSRVAVKKRRGILFIGSSFHAPNTQAVQFLCQEIVPRVDQKLIERHPVLIVGDGMNNTDLGEPGDAEIRPVGWVPSVVPYLQHARLSILPLLYGAGTKGKLIQALMAGTPTVSTRIGIEGFGLTSGEHVLVADDAEGLASAVSELLTNDDECERLIKSGREWVLEHHSRAVTKRAFLDAMQTALSLDPKPERVTEDPALFEERMTYQEMQRFRDRLSTALSDIMAPDGAVAVITGGSTELLRLGSFTAWRYPSLEADSAVPAFTESIDAARVDLENLKNHGATFLVVPAPCMGWLGERPVLREYLDCTYPMALEEPTLGIVYSLRPPRAAARPPSAEQVVEPEPAEPQLAGSSGEARVEERQRESAPGSDVRLIAFYLPQFHPIPENDRWWGAGFTEWTNVVRAQPLFPDHYQPHIPSDLGFYDLRLAELREAQADLASSHGIHGFCYYHYWFEGQRLLERPFDEVLASNKPDFPFCLCWANEPWSRRWDGRPHDVLQPQSYSKEDDVEHIRWLLPALLDPRAITIDGKPLLIIYQARDLPDPARTVDIWREEADRAGLPGLYLMSIETGWDAGWDATEVGLDAKVLFQPQFSMLFEQPLLDVGPETTRVYDYGEAWRSLANPEPVSYRRYETVCARWDNSPRTGEDSVVLHNSTPAAYQEWLTTAISRVIDQPEQNRLVFLNAWNEWGEGCHLEPDLLHGRGYLEATKQALLAADPAPAT
jgi:glycosyltransferase involved in cell wall biosynthesis